MSPGRPIRLIETGEQSVITDRLEDGTFRLANGRVVRAGELWPLPFERSLLERLAAGEGDDSRTVLARLKCMQLLETRQAHGLGSFLGSEIADRAVEGERGGYVEDLQQRHGGSSLGITGSPGGNCGWSG